MRSKLFVPGSRPELFAKALASAADAVSIDLEDSVAEDRKDAARESVRAFLAADPHPARRILVVRVNAPDTSHFAADLATVVHPAVSLINVPKIESAEGVHAAVAAVEDIEQRMGVTRPVALLVNIETPRALRRAASIAAAHPRVAGLQLGLGDLFEPAGIARRDARHVHAAMFAVRMAAAEAGVFAYDGAFADLRDADGFRTEAMMSRSLGFLGKSCVHPSQIAAANEVFAPTDDEIAQALRVVAAAAAHHDAGVGAFALDGRMIDAPFVRRAEDIVAQARALGRVAT